MEQYYEDSIWSDELLIDHKVSAAAAKAGVAPSGNDYFHEQDRQLLLDALVRTNHLKPSGQPTGAIMQLFIRRDKFPEYLQFRAEDTMAEPEGGWGEWPWSAIDWDEAADIRESSYTKVTLPGDFEYLVEVS